MAIDKLVRFPTSELPPQSVEYQPLKFHQKKKRAQKTKFGRIVAQSESESEMGL